MDANRFVGANAHRVGDARHGVSPAVHRCGSVFGVNLAVEDRCWGGGFARADGDDPNHLLVGVVGSQPLVGKIDHDAGDDLEHGEKGAAAPTSSDLT